MTTDDELLAVLAAGPPTTSPRSILDRVLSSYGEQGRAGLEAVLANPDWTTASIHKVLNDAGHRVCLSAVRAYRKNRFKI